MLNYTHYPTPPPMAGMYQAQQHHQQQHQRIPESLQAVFLASNRGNDVTLAPPEQVASRSFANLRRSYDSPQKQRGTYSSPRRKLRNLARTITTVVLSPIKQHRSASPVKKQPAQQQQQQLRFPSPVKQQRATSTAFKQTGPTPVTPTIAPRPTRTIHQGELQHQQSLSVRSPAKKKRLPTLSPQQYLDALMRNRGYPVTPIKTLETAFCNKPTALQKASYNVYLIEAAKQENPTVFRTLLETGLSPNPCNVYGESLLHMVCRRGANAALQVLLDCGTELCVCDDYGRTPLHDAMWCSEPSFATVDLLLQRRAPGRESWYMFHMRDSRGSTPLSYIRREHWERWIQFLESRKELYWPKVTGGSLTYPAVVTDEPQSRPLPDPEHALSLELATMVASGKMSPAEVTLLLLEDDSDDDSEEEDDDDDDESFDGSDDEDDSDYDSEEDDDDENSDDSSSESYDDDEMSIDEDMMRDVLYHIAPRGGGPKCGTAAGATNDVRRDGNTSLQSSMEEFGTVLDSLSRGSHQPMAWSH